MRTADYRLVHPLLELKDNRIGFLLTLLLQGLTGNASFLRLVFDVIELVDVGQRLACRPLILVQRFGPLTAGVCPAANHLDMRIALELVVCAIAVRLDSSPITAKKLARSLMGAGAHIIVERHQLLRHGTGTPHVSLRRTVLLVVYYGQRALIHLHVVS